MSSLGIPEDVLRNILSSLPAKSLLRFQCVCKFWCALIQSPSFKKQQCLQSTSRDDGQILVLSGRRKGKMFNNISLSLVAGDDLHDVYNHADFPFKFSRHPSFMSICHGIFCIFFQREKQIIFWNPAIREVRVLENLTLDCAKATTWRDHAGFSLGFGFDLKTNDYKVIGLLSSWSDDSRTSHRLPTKAQVYSLSKDMWREIEPSGPSYDGHLNEGSYAHGMFYWLVYNPSSVSVLSFDLANEVFHWMPLPDTIEGRMLNLSTLNDHLALIFHPFYRIAGAFDVWLRNGDPIGGSWVKQYAFNPCYKIDDPRLLWKNGLFLTSRTMRKMIFYDICTGEETEIHFDGARYGLQMFIYRESLFSVKPLRSAISC